LLLQQIFLKKQAPPIIMQRKLVLTGGPGVGKTSLIELLEKIGQEVVPEAAREIITEQEQTEDPILPWRDFVAFQRLVTDSQKQAEDGIQTGLAFLDRGFIDQLGYFAEQGLPPSHDLYQLIREAGYTGVFLLAPVLYKKDAQRQEDEAKAKRLHAEITRAWEEQGFEIIHIDGTKGQRLDQILNHLGIEQEIERKFLIREKGVNYIEEEFFRLYVCVEQLLTQVNTEGIPIRQGYLNPMIGMEIAAKAELDVDFEPAEARLRNYNNTYLLTIKGKGVLARNEAEIEITSDIFEQYWPATEGRRIEKIRLVRPFQEHKLEVDAYTDRDLVVAEVETPTHEAAENIKNIGKDITDDPNYKNHKLAS